MGQQPDLIHEYAKYGLLDLCQRDAIREAEGPAMMAIWRINMLQFWSGKQHKYLKAGHRLLAGLLQFYSDNIFNDRMSINNAWA